MQLLKLGVLASGRGSSLAYLIRAIQNHYLAASIELIISDKAFAPVLNYQKKYGIETLYIDPQKKSRLQYEELITSAFRVRQVELILLVGYMRILSREFVNKWHDKILNVHPSLLPAFAGLMDLDVHRAVLKAKVKKTGCTIHYVTEKVDSGPIFLQKKCSIMPYDTPTILKAKVQELEKEAFLEAVEKIAADKLY